jgi:hypothetical protein
LIIALFYIFTLFDPNTLVNARKGFKATMDEAFGKNGWRAGRYSYSYQDRTMTVNDLWITGFKQASPTDQLVIHVEKLAISHLTWASVLKSLLAAPLPGEPSQILTSKVVAEEIQFLGRQPHWRLQGRLRRLTIQKLNFQAPPPAPPGRGSAPGFLASFWAGLRAEKVQLEGLRTQGHFFYQPASFTFNLASWALVKPQWSHRGLNCSPGSQLAGVSFGLKTHGTLFSGRVDELAHDGATRWGYMDQLAFRNLTMWLEPATQGSLLKRVERKKSPPPSLERPTDSAPNPTPEPGPDSWPEPWLEITIGDHASQYLDFQSLAQRLATALTQPRANAPQEPEPLDLLAFVSPRDLIFGGISIFQSHWRHLSLTFGGLTGQVNQAELSIANGQQPYALSLRLADGWYSFSPPHQSSPPQWLEFYQGAEALDLAAGRFHFSSQAYYEPNQQSYQLAGDLDLKNIFHLSLSLGWGDFSRPFLAALERGSLKETLFLSAPPAGWEDIALAQGLLRYQDQGLTERALTYYSQKNAPPSDLAARKEKVIFGLALALTLSMEKYLDNAKELTDLIVSFLRQPGALTIATNPTPAISYRGYQAARTVGDLLDSAHLTVTYNASEPKSFIWKKPWKVDESPLDAPVDWLERLEKSDAP